MAIEPVVVVVGQSCPNRRRMIYMCRLVELVPRRQQIPALNLALAGGIGVLITVKCPMCRGKNLGCFQNHLDHVRIHQGLCGLDGITVYSEDVHRSCLPRMVAKVGRAAIKIQKAVGKYGIMYDIYSLSQCTNDTIIIANNARIVKITDGGLKNIANQTPQVPTIPTTTPKVNLAITKCTCHPNNPSSREDEDWS